MIEVKNMQDGKKEEYLKCDMYFADLYFVWQKGTNENFN